jgi:hypothetical protein
MQHWFYRCADQYSGHVPALLGTLICLTVDLDARTERPGCGATAGQTNARVGFRFRFLTQPYKTIALQDMRQVVRPKVAGCHKDRSVHADSLGVR